MRAESDSRRLGVVLLIVTLVGCASGQEPEPPGTNAGAAVSGGAAADPSGGLVGLARSEGVRVVDLTHALGSDSLYWPTGSPFEHERLAWGADDVGDWYASAAFSSPEHLRTHLDAPIHFAESGWTSAEIPVDRLVGPGVLVDISSRCATDPDATLEASDLTAWEAEHGTIPAGAIVIVRTGWASHWPDWEAYYGSPTPKDVATFHFPGVSLAAAEALVDRAIAGVGIDTASIDRGMTERFESHRALASGEVFNLENLTALDGLPASDFLVVALPMKIAGGTGGPARVVAVVSEVGS